MILFVGGEIHSTPRIFLGVTNQGLCWGFPRSSHFFITKTVWSTWASLFLSWNALAERLVWRKSQAGRTQNWVPLNFPFFSHHRRILLQATCPRLASYRLIWRKQRREPTWPSKPLLSSEPSCVLKQWQERHLLVWPISVMMCHPETLCS